MEAIQGLRLDGKPINPALVRRLLSAADEAIVRWSESGVECSRMDDSIEELADAALRIQAAVHEFDPGPRLPRFVRRMIRRRLAVH